MRVNKTKLLKLCLVLGIAVSINEVKAQWSYGTIAGVGNTRGQDIAKDQNGDVYVCGTFDGFTRFPAVPNIPATSGAGDAAYIAKFNPSGVLQWINYDRGTGISDGDALAVDTVYGRMFVTGEASGNSQWMLNGLTPGGFSPGTGVLPITNYYVYCFNKTSGNYISAYDVSTAALPPGFASFDITSMSYRAFQITLLGNVHTIYHLYICGSAINAGVRRGIVTCVVYNAFLNSWNTLWSTAAAGGMFTDSRCNDIIYNPVANNVCVTGDFVISVGFPGAGGAGTAGSSDAFSAIFNPINGSSLAAPVAAGTAVGRTASGTALVCDGAGNTYFTGWFTGPLANVFGLGLPPLGAPAAQRNTYVVRVGGGNWATSISSAVSGQNQSTGITWNTSNVYVYGSFITNDINIFPTTYAYTSSGGGGENRTYLARLTRASGALNDGNVTVSTLVSDHIPTRIAYRLGTLHSTGSYRNELDYNAGPLAPLVSPLPGIYEMFVMRNDANAPFDYFRPSETTGITEAGLADTQISVFPNPTNDKINLKIANLKGDVKFMIFDQKGSLVKEEIISQMDSEIDMNNLTSGLYLIKVKGENINYSQKIVKQ